MTKGERIPMRGRSEEETIEKGREPTLISDIRKETPWREE